MRMLISVNICDTVWQVVPLVECSRRKWVFLSSMFWHAGLPVRSFLAIKSWALATPFSVGSYGEVRFWPHFLCIFSSAVGPDSHWFWYPDLCWQKWPTKREKVKKCFEVLDVLFWGLGGFSCSLNVLRRGLGIKILFFYKDFLIFIIVQFLSLNCWTRIRCAQKLYVINHIIWLSDNAGHVPEQRRVQMGPPVRWLSLPLF